MMLFGLYREKFVKSSPNINQKYHNITDSSLSILLKHNFLFLELKNKALMSKRFSRFLNTEVGGPWFMNNLLNKLLLINAVSGRCILYILNDPFNSVMINIGAN